MNSSAARCLKHRNINVNFKSIWMLYAFLVPAVVLTFLFNYLPMISNYIAFLDYDITNGWMGFGSPFVGLKNFSFLQDPWFYELAGRTVLYSFVGIVAGFPAPLVIALLLNELKNIKFKKFVQTVSYIPHFVSWTTIAGLLYIFLSTDTTGLVNNIKIALFGGERYLYMQDSFLFLPIATISGIWKELGWGTILYLAAITGIDPQQYEAAEVDGATRWQRMLHVTLPGLIPTLCILLIFSLGGLFTTNFDQIFNLQNDVIREATNTINVYTYYAGVRGQQYSLSTAVGLFQGLVSFVLISLTNYATKKLSEVALF